MNNQDKATFSLDDDEIVEEEAIDRDEYYDDEGGEYDEDYGGEEYGDEEAYDEGGEEGYDDGYSDDYYDDRLNKVLDELAELKRGMTPASLQPQQALMPPQYIYQPTAPPAGSEVVMYNEISRLRDELARNQSNLEMQKELARIKEDMQRDQKFAEAQYSAEIKRLQDKVDDLLKNGSGPQGELLAGDEPVARIEGGIHTPGLDKLLSINEAILRAMRESDARVQNELAQLKKQLDDIPSAKELNGAVSAVKKAMSGLDAAGLSGLARLSDDLAALKATLEGVSGAPVAQASAGAMAESAQTKVQNADIAPSELLRQLYDIKTAIGSASTAAVKRAQILYELVCDYKKVSFDVHSQSASYKDKLNSVYALAKKLGECTEPDAVDLISALNDIISDLSEQELNRAVFSDLVAYCNERGINAVTSAMRDSGERYFSLVKKLLDADADGYSSYLSDVVAEINTLQDNKFEAENAEALAEITADLLDANSDKSAVREKIEELVLLDVSDIFDLPRVDAPKVYKPSRSDGSENIFTKLAEIKAAVLDRPPMVMPVRANENGEEQELSLNEAALQQIMYSVDELKNKLETVTASDGVPEALEELRGNYLDIANKLVDLSERLQRQPVSDDFQSGGAGLSEEERQLMLDDLGYIRSRLDEYETFFANINELRNDIVSMSGNSAVPAQLSEQINTLLTDINAQFDKLYEDMTNVILETETNIINHLGDGAATLDAISGVKAEVLADTQEIKDSLSADTQEIKESIAAEAQAIKDAVLNVSDVLMTSSSTDAVEQLRADIGSFIDATAANTEAASADRQKLLDDIAFLREQAELAIAESEQIPDAAEAVRDTEKFIAYLDEIAARVTLIHTLVDETNALKETVGSVNDNVALLSDNVASYNENVGGIADGISTITDTLSAVNDSVSAVSDSIAAISDNFVAVNENFTVINDNVTSVNEGIASVNENITIMTDVVRPLSQDIAAVNDSVNIITENVNTVVETVRPLTDSMATVNDNVAAVNDNIGVIGENVAATLELVRPLAESVGDNIAQLGDNLSIVGENVSLVNDNVAAVLEAVQPISGDVVSARDAAAAALEALAPISEQLNSILERLDAQTQQLEANEDAENLETSPVENDELAEIRASLNTVIDSLALVPQADDLVATRDNTDAIIETLGNVALENDVLAIRDSVLNVLDVVNMLSESVAAIGAGDTQSVADTIAALKETVDSSAEDIRLIREKLDGAPVEEGEIAGDETLQALSQNVEYVMARLEQFELTAASNKQEIIDTVAGIKEEIHIGALDEGMTAAGLDGETREALLGEIADIRERLAGLESAAQAQGDSNAAAADSISAQLGELYTLLDGINAGRDSGEGAALDADNMQALVSELSAIKEKLDAAPEYDTVEEILSLREDIKAARIVDQGEVAGELESIKNELASISSGNILDEIRALREDISNLPAGDGGAAPTDGEINLVLNEIVSLRDEVFAFKDEVINATGGAAPVVNQSESEVVRSDDYGTILDEITALRADQTALTGSIDELKDIVSRRTSLSVAESEEQGETQSSVSAGELEVVLDEIINLKNDIVRIEESVGGERLSTIAAQVDDIRAIIDEIRAVPNGGETADVVDGENETRVAAQTVDLSPVLEQLEYVNATLDDIRLNRDAAAGVVVDGDGGMTLSLAERFDGLQNEIAEVKAAVVSMAPIDYAVEIEQMRAEIEALRAENAQLKSGIETPESLSAQLAELKDAIHDLALNAQPVQSENGDASYAVLIDEVRALREQMIQNAQPQYVGGGLDDDTINALREIVAAQSEKTSFASELNDIRDEIAQLRSLTSITAESGGIGDVSAIRNEFAELKNLLSTQEHLFGVAEDVTTIKADVRTLKDEPDLGVMSEILALRDEFQALREQIEDVKRVAGETNRGADASLLSEVQSLRDQLFAISMANVNDPSSGETNYESYNNIILDEIASLRDQVAAAGSASDMEAIASEFDKLKDTLDRREQQYNALAERIAKTSSDVSGNKILEEIDKLRGDMANQRDADLATLNFMSEMAHLIERQNQYLSQNSGSKISDEIESLKAEIASSDAVAEEVAKLRAIMTQSGSAADNETILATLAEMREELSREKPSRENALILGEIARLRGEITQLAEREQARDINSDEELSSSLYDLKEQLNEIAGIVEPAGASKQSGAARSGEKSSTSKKTSTKRSTSKSTRSVSRSTSTSTSGKRGKKSTAGRRPRGVRTDNAINPATSVSERRSDSKHRTERSEFDFESLIEQQASKLGGKGELSLNPNVTADTLDVADRLAKQVANKLIMEQLVEQLGDGGVSEERVDEILRDILPQEFTTIAETEASDKVRRLANSLVLNKLRARLNGNKPTDDD